MVAWDLTRVRGAVKAIVTVDVHHEEVVSSAVEIIGKGGTIVRTGLGGGNPTHDTPMLVHVAKSGQSTLPESVTQRSTLE